MHAAGAPWEGSAMTLEPVLAFVMTYAAFLVSGLLFRLDLVYYNALAKPSYTPPGAVIGLVWALLFACISLAVALLVAQVGLTNVGGWLWAALAANWFFNQAYSYIQFVRKEWLFAAFDSGLVALTAIAFIVLAWNVNPISAWLFVPYAAWASFATYLSYAVWALNR
jgi:tryptophan-rich sensory protein